MNRFVLFFSLIILALFSCKKEKCQSKIVKEYLHEASDSLFATIPYKANDTIVFVGKGLDTSVLISSEVKHYYQEEFVDLIGKGLECPDQEKHINEVYEINYKGSGSYLLNYSVKFFSSKDYIEFFEFKVNNEFSFKMPFNKTLDTFWYDVPIMFRGKEVKTLKLNEFFSKSAILLFYKDEGIVYININNSYLYTKQ
jgi:hypothetical protein